MPKDQSGRIKSTLTGRIVHQGDDFERFQSLTENLIQVPKKEIDRKRSRSKDS